MFLRLVADSFGRRPRRKLLTGAALALGMAVVTAAFSVSLDVGDRLAHEFRALGANLLITPQADSLPLEIGGVDYRPVNSGSYPPGAGLGQNQNNFLAQQYCRLRASNGSTRRSFDRIVTAAPIKTTLVGTWAHHSVVPTGRPQLRDRNGSNQFLVAR